MRMNEWVQKKSLSAVPLNGLLAFEAVARHMSIKAAAVELSLTPSAISHRLRLLEKVLGCKLVGRVGSRLELTEIGKSLASPLTDGFEQILHAVEGVRRHQPPSSEVPVHD